MTTFWIIAVIVVIGLVVYFLMQGKKAPKVPKGPEEGPLPPPPAT